ncbi:hypothetical protein TNCV_452471 [Trichonephila clavipes]|nr:hypothetical protein TNCV_452471 [Trichonephila clavipes]
MAFGGSLPQINLGVQGVTQGGHHRGTELIWSTTLYKSEDIRVRISITAYLNVTKLKLLNQNNLKHKQSTGPALSGPRSATAGSDVVQSGRPIFDDFFQHLWPYIGNNTANVVFQMVKRLWLIHIDQ